MFFLPRVEGKPWEQKISTIDAYLDSITCPKIGETGFTHYKCALNRCMKCPKPQIHDSERIGEDAPTGTKDFPNEAMVTWKQHMYIYEC